MNAVSVDDIGEAISDMSVMHIIELIYDMEKKYDVNKSHKEPISVKEFQERILQSQRDILEIQRANFQKAIVQKIINPPLSSRIMGLGQKHLGRKR